MEQAQKHEKKDVEGTPIAIVRVRGTANINPKTTSALEHLRLRAKNNCIVRSDSAWLRGMLGRCKDHVTFGQISKDTLSKLNSSKFVHDQIFCLPPPRKGFGRKGIKKAFVEGGALGDRGDKMDDLIMRMI